jgi:hypothetical protein
MMAKTKDTYIYDRVTELLREQGHTDPEHATEEERFKCALLKAMKWGKRDHDNNARTSQ